MRAVLRLLSRTFLLALFVVATFLPSLPANTFAQSSPETWMDFVNEPEVDYGEIYSAQDYLENHQVIQSVYGDRQCQINSIPITADIPGQPDCWYSSSLGDFLRGGALYRQAGQLYTGSVESWSSLVFPTKNEDVVFEQTHADNITGFLRRDEALESTITIDPTGLQPSDYTWSNPASLTFEYQNGSPYDFNDNTVYSQVTYSNNGRWMNIWDPSGYVIRVDLENMTISTYRIAVGDQTGYAATAISDSGRYIAAYVYGYDFVLLDTQGCTNSLPYIEVPGDTTPCQTRDMNDFRREYLDAMRNLYPYFYGDDVLGIRGINQEDDLADEFIIRAPNTSRRDYVALGDSFSSGEGAGSYIDGTDTEDQSINMCHTSTKSYPYYINNRLDLDSFLSVACSGAKIENFWQWAQKPLTPAFRGDKFPGMRPQNEVLADADIVTITMSGNDIGFADKLSYCLIMSTHCYNSYEERLEIANEIKDQYPRLVDMYKNIMGTTPSKKRLYVLGYPQIVDGAENASCGANVNFNYYQRRMINDLITYFNAVIKEAADSAGAFYVGTEGAFDGYQLCSGPYQISAVNGLTFGDETPVSGFGPFSNGSYHPTAIGQRLLADKVLQKTDNLSKGMPRKDWLSEVPDPLNYPFLDAPSGGGLVHRLKYSPVVDNAVIQRGVPFIVKVGKDIVVHGPVSIVRFVLFSDPVQLGETTTNPDGTLQAALTIPAETPAGIHELRIDGFDENNQPVSLRQYVLVYANIDDLDGDGISTTNETCGEFVVPLGEDLDINGKDDACNSVGVVPQDDSETKDTQMPQSHPSNNDTSHPASSVAGLSSFLSKTSYQDNDIDERTNTESPATQSSQRSWYLLLYTFVVLLLLRLGVSFRALLRRK